MPLYFLYIHLSARLCICILVPHSHLIGISNYPIVNELYKFFCSKRLQPWHNLTIYCAGALPRMYSQINLHTYKFIWLHVMIRRNLAMAMSTLKETTLLSPPDKAHHFISRFQFIFL